MVLLSPPLRRQSARGWRRSCAARPSPGGGGLGVNLERIGEHDAVSPLGLLARDELVAHVARHAFGVAGQRVAPAAAAAAFEYERLAGLEADVAEHLRKP